MPKRIPTQTIIMHRDGKRVTVKPGVSFDFTADEIKDIKQSSPDALRTLVNEEVDVPEQKAPEPRLDAGVAGSRISSKTGTTKGVAGTSSNDDL